MKIMLIAEADDITLVDATAVQTAAETAGMVVLNLEVNNAGFQVLKLV